MTPDKFSQARAVTTALTPLTPAEGANGSSCVGPAALVARFEEYLREREIKVHVFLGLEFPDRIRYAEALLEVDRATHLSLTKDFGDCLAMSPGVNIPGYWGGSLPVECPDSQQGRETS